MISQTITQKIAEALKAKDEIRLSTLRLLASALNYEFIAKQHKLNGDEELEVVRREAKKRKEAIGAYEKVQDKLRVGERIEKEKKELAILEEYLPAQMSDEELAGVVDSVIAEAKASTTADVGRVMGSLMAKVAGRADGGRVSEIVKSKLS